jgi:hypothetical protein
MSQSRFLRSVPFVVAGGAIAALLGAAPAAGAIRCVNLDGGGGCSTSLQATLDAARNGDVIEVAAGSYAPDVGDVIVVGTPVTVRGQGVGSTVIEAAVRVADSAVRAALSDLTVHGSVVAPTKTVLELRRCLVEYDAPPDSEQGVFAGQLRIEDCTVRGFPLRGVAVQRGTITRSTISGNGGLSHGAAGAGLIVYKQLRLTSSTVSGNVTPSKGGGIYLDRGAGLALADSTVSDNQASWYGGGVYVEDAYVTNRFKSPYANARIERSTIAGNTAGIYGGGLYAGGRSRVKIDASIVGDNSAPSGPDCQAGSSYPLRTRFGLLVGSTSDCVVISGPGSPLLQADPLLAPLQDNGGPTETRLPSPGSQALDAVTANASCRHPDQRGVARTTPCDLGAVEAP